MPTYTWGCGVCEQTVEQFLALRDYVERPPQFFCCGEPMQRVLTPVHLAVVSESSYTNMRAPDGTDISTRAKHREYMRRNNLTTVDDFKQTWQRQAAAREAMAAGVDPQRKQDLADAITKLGG